MSTLHLSLIELRNALGYAKQDSGVCALYANMAINAFLIGELNTFRERCASIKKKMKEPAFLNLIKKLRASSYSTIKETGSTEEQKELAELMDMMAFIESGELYLKPELYSHVFAKSLSQSYKVAISAFAQSKELEQRGGRALAKSFVGIYTFEELKDYIRLLNCLAENAQQDFALNLSSDIHSIGLCYSHGSKSWQLFDANQPELLSIPSKNSNWEECLAVQIKQAFFGDTYILFQSVIWTTGLTAPGFRKSMSTFSGDFHNIPSYNVLTNARGFSLIHLAARDGEVDALRFCVEAKDQNGNYRVDLNNTTKNGVTPVYMAAQEGHIEVLGLLLGAKNKDGSYRADLNKSQEDGATPVYIAAQNGHVKSLQLLLEAKEKDGANRADLNKFRVDGSTPVFIAAQKGHKAVITELLKHDVDINLAFKSSVGALKQFAQNHSQDVIKKMSEFTKSKAEAEELLMKPKDIAWVMGHDDIVNLFERKKVVDQIQASIKTIETPMSLVGTMNIPSAYRLHQVLNKGLKAYKDKVYECAPSALKELNAEFIRSCEEVQKAINDKGLTVEPRYGDAINNVLTAIINALNHLLSLPAKVMTWDNGYTLFHRKDYTSPEIRKVFGELGKISQVIADQCEPIQSSIQV